MLRTLCRGANLVIALDSPDIPDCVKEVSELMKVGKKLSSEIGEIPVVDDQDGAKPSKCDHMPDMLCSITYKALIQRLTLVHKYNPLQISLISSRVKFVNRVSWKGRSITTYNSSSKNGIIEYNPVNSASNTLDRQVGQVLEIFHHVSECLETGKDIQKTFISLLRFRSLNHHDELQNPFKNCPHLKYQLCYSNPTEDQIKQHLGSSQNLIPEVICIDQVFYPTASHIYKSGTFGIYFPTIAIKSLSRGRHTWG